MTTSNLDVSTLASASYAVLRQGGTSPTAARSLLDLPTATANRFEQLFQRRPRGGQDPMRPRFARHEAHVAAVMAAGGYPVLAR
ncbi:MAG TPA: hypothetical protein VHN73_04920 [Phenylobacterium sp.]|jgi:hypothetical protein|nr:hypothetical protein [Phenylobacterium sp.]